ncbi:MAG: GNAT family N-acetyltransferase [Bacteroidota bacterium]
MSTQREKTRDFWREHHPKPYFHFPDIPASERLNFAYFDEKNAWELHKLVKDEINPFIPEDYKDPERFAEYIKDTEVFGAYSPKHSFCEWLIYTKEQEACIGVVGLYELSLETFNDNHRKCNVGIVIGEKYRKNYYALEAINQLVTYAHQELDMNKLVAYMKKNNEVSKQLFRKLGFLDNTEAYYYADKYDYFERKL